MWRRSKIAGVYFEEKVSTRSANCFTGKKITVAMCTALVEMKLAILLSLISK
jgi:hypothetical protein